MPHFSAASRNLIWVKGAWPHLITRPHNLATLISPKGARTYVPEHIIWTTTHFPHLDVHSSSVATGEKATFHLWYGVVLKLCFNTQVVVSGIPNEFWEIAYETNNACWSPTYLQHFPNTSNTALGEYGCSFWALTLSCVLWPKLCRLAPAQLDASGQE